MGVMLIHCWTRAEALTGLVTSLWKHNRAIARRGHGTPVRIGLPCGLILLRQKSVLSLL